MNAVPPGLVSWGSTAARRVVLTCVLGSSIAFLDTTVVNVALPHIQADLHTGLAGLQWVVDAYLVTLSALVLVGGALGDRYGRRRIFLVGVYGFTASSLAAGLAPTIGTLVIARTAQGAAAALLMPSSLSLLTASIEPDERGRAVGAWAGLTGVAGAIGPLLGGWLVDALSWRWVFFINIPLATAVVVTARGVREPAIAQTTGRIDVRGGLLAIVGLGTGTAGIIGHGSPFAPVAIAAGAVVLAVFVITERRRPTPMLPLDVFSSRQFSGANGVTLAVYSALGVATFLVVFDLQRTLRYSAFEAGAALIPVTLLLLALSVQVGALAQRIGATLPMVIGPVVAAAGLFWLGNVEPGDHYVSSVMPGVVVLGIGLALTVAPLTAAVMAAVGEGRLGLASGVNNAVARLAGLLGVAAVPAVAGVNFASDAGRAMPGYHRALVVAAILCASGSVIAAFTIRRVRPVRPTAQATLLEACQDSCLLENGHPLPNTQSAEG